MTRVLSHVGALPGVSAALPGAEVVAIPTEGPLDADVQGEVLVTLMHGTPNLVEVLDRGVRWVHTVGTGMDGFPLGAIGDRTLSCSRGASADFIAEWVMAQLLTVAKRLPDSWVHEPPETWGGAELLGSLQGAAVGIFGLGTIGVALARRLVPFGADVRVLRRSESPSPVDGVQVVRTVEDLVNGADHVVLAAPLTDATRGVVDASFLAAMPVGSHLVNVSRAGLVDEAALQASLDAGHLDIASIDVAPVEPLPAGHWFYEHPRVRFSPHVSWSGPGLWEAMERSFVSNYQAWSEGLPLPDVVDVTNGY